MSSTYPQYSSISNNKELIKVFSSFCKAISTTIREIKDELIGQPKIRLVLKTSCAKGD